MASAPNTPTFVYLDTESKKTDCGKEQKKIEDACKPPDKNKPSVMEKLLGKKAAAKIQEVKSKIAKAGHSPQWLMDHCDGLMLKPVSPKTSSEIGEIANELKNLTAGDAVKIAKQHIDDAVRVLEQATKDLAVATAEKAALKAAGRWGAGMLLGPVGEIVATVVNVVDAGLTAWELAQKVGDIRGEINGLKDVIKEIPKKLEDIAKDAASNPQKAVADTMSIISRLDACIRARRCQLVPMRETHNGSIAKCDDSDEEVEEAFGPATGKGCCPGQTGHHILPKAMFKNCAAYNTGGASGCAHQQAPTVCVEGVNNTHGTHGAMHRQLDQQMKKYSSGKMTMDQAIDEGAESVKKVFPESGCSEKCLKAQLESFYKKYKNCSPLEASSGSPASSSKGGD